MQYRSLRILRLVSLLAWCGASAAAFAQNAGVPAEEDNGYEPGETVEEPADAPERPAAPTAASPSAVQTPPADDAVPAPNVIRLQGLNKVTARISTLEGPIGTVMHFGNLDVIARRCWQSPPGERPENGALLEIREAKPGESPQTIFSGWMFSSSPGLSALEHPVYDVTVLACLHRDTLE